MTHETGVRARVSATQRRDVLLPERPHESAASHSGREHRAARRVNHQVAAELDGTAAVQLDQGALVKRDAEAAPQRFPQKRKQRVNCGHAVAAGVLSCRKLQVEVQAAAAPSRNNS